MTITESTKNVEAEVRDFIESWISASRDRDVDAEVDHYAQNGLGYSLAPPLYHDTGGESHRKALKHWQTGFQGEMSFEIQDLRIFAEDEVAFCYFLKQMSATTTEGESFSFWMRSTLGLQKVSGQWKIAHEHESVPFYMDGSFLAAVDLNPD